jgi:diketogulonate reductase-like aldo/keto reductase
VQRGLPLMAYSPIDQGAIARDARLAALARPLGVTAAQLALAWTLRDGGVIAIPKAVREPHLRENLAAAGLALDPGTCAAIDALFAPPRGPSPLAMT